MDFEQFAATVTCVIVGGFVVFCLGFREGRRYESKLNAKWYAGRQERHQKFMEEWGSSAQAASPSADKMQGSSFDPYDGGGR